MAKASVPPVRRQRSLRDIGLLGRTVTFDDPQAGEPAEGCGDCTEIKGACPAHGGRQTVWIQKLNPGEHSSAVRKANAARARMRATFNDQDSDEYMELVDDLEGRFSTETEIEMLVAEDLNKLKESVAAELEFGTDEFDQPTEWGKDSYLQGIRDDWLDHGLALWEEDEDDPEAVRILDEIKRFTALVDDAIKPQLDDMKEQYKALAEETLRERVMEKFIKLRCEDAWITEFEKCELWLSTRKPCDSCLAGEPHSFVHDDFYFALGRNEIDELPDEIYDPLIAQYHEMVTSISEGKGLPGIPASSDSSESPASSETEPASGPEVAAV